MITPKKIRQFYQPAAGWLFSGMMSRAGMILLCAGVISLYAAVWDPNMVWAFLGVLVAGLCLGFLVAEDEAAAVDAKIEEKEAITTQKVKETESYGSELVVYLSVFCDFLTKKLIKTNKEVLSALFLIFGSIVHTCITPRITPTPLSAC